MPHMRFQWYGLERSAVITLSTQDWEAKARADRKVCRS